MFWEGHALCMVNTHQKPSNAPTPGVSIQHRLHQHMRPSHPTCTSFAPGAISLLEGLCLRRLRLCLFRDDIRERLLRHLLAAGYVHCERHRLEKTEKKCHSSKTPAKRIERISKRRKSVGPIRLPPKPNPSQASSRAIKTPNQDSNQDNRTQTNQAKPTNSKSTVRMSTIAPADQGF